MTKIQNNYISLGTNLTIARDILEKLELDIIIYPDIGMKLLPTLLAYSRIAPIQITTWGHSETSGIDTIDYFISSDYFAGSLSFDELQKQYSEKLILFKSLGTFYISPHKLFIENNKAYNTKDSNTKQPTPKKFKTREELGFTKTNNLYVCLQTFYKLNPEFEQCLSRILELDPYGIILLSNTFPFCKSHLERLRTIIGCEKIKRVKWYASLEKDEFLNIVSISDVCLDPFPFGGCNTSYDAFDYNIPVITLPSQFLHGQFTNGLYKKMEGKKTIDSNECIVSTPEEYAQVATSIGINEKLKHKINRNIEMKKHLIFQEQESIEEWNNFLDSFVN
jgi:protein O-GlcNAc transferase